MFDFQVGVKQLDAYISIEKNQVDKYFIDGGIKDWPMPFSKVRLRGTVYCESESYDKCVENGICAGVFKMDNVSSR